MAPEGGLTAAWRSSGPETAASLLPDRSGHIESHVERPGGSHTVDGRTGASRHVAGLSGAVGRLLDAGAPSEERAPVSTRSCTHVYNSPNRERSSTAGLHAGSLVEYNSSTRRGSSYPTRSE